MSILKVVKAVMKGENITQGYPIIHWYSINLYATYYQDTNPNQLKRSNTNLDEEKIVVNVIKDKSSKRKSISKSKTSSRTMEDLFQVAKTQRSTIERVIIIDRPDDRSPAPVQPIYYNVQPFFFTTSYAFTYPFLYFH